MGGAGWLGRLFIPFVLQSLERQKDGVLKVLCSVLLKVFFSLNSSVSVKIMVVANVLEEGARPWWFSHVTSVTTCRASAKPNQAVLEAKHGWFCSLLR